MIKNIMCIYYVQIIKELKIILSLFKKSSIRIGAVSSIKSLTYSLS